MSLYRVGRSADARIGASRHDVDELVGDVDGDPWIEVDEDGQNGDNAAPEATRSRHLGLDAFEIDPSLRTERRHSCQAGGQVYKNCLAKGHPARSQTPNSAAAPPC